jgi:flagellar biosynthesis protein FliQ
MKMEMATMMMNQKMETTVLVAAAKVVVEMIVVMIVAMVVVLRMIMSLQLSLVNQVAKLRLSLRRKSLHPRYVR